MVEGYGYSGRPQQETLPRPRMNTQCHPCSAGPEQRPPASITEPVFHSYARDDLSLPAIYCSTEAVLSDRLLEQHPRNHLSPPSRSQALILVGMVIHCMYNHHSSVEGVSRGLDSGDWCEEGSKHGDAICIPSDSLFLPRSLLARLARHSCRRHRQHFFVVILPQIQRPDVSRFSRSSGLIHLLSSLHALGALTLAASFWVFPFEILGARALE